jgi:hypothetical protein
VKEEEEESTRDEQADRERAAAKIVQYGNIISAVFVKVCVVYF